MAAPDHSAGHSINPTQRIGFKHVSRNSDDLTSIYRPLPKDVRSASTGNSQHGAKSLLTAGLPGSFSSDLRSATQIRSATPFADGPPVYAPSRLSKEDDTQSVSEQRQATIRDMIAKEMKIKMGTENMLEALLSKNNRQTREQRLRVDQELGTSNRKLAELRLELDQEILRSQTPTTPPRKRMSSYFTSSPLKSPALAQSPLADFAETIESESPTVILTETLQALEAEGMQPEYYIDRANTLVDLFKRNTTLKYDLAWSVFSLRVQVMLLSESADVVAAGYRLTRYAITDRVSLQTIRALHTDELVTLSLAKKGKAMLEREQAVKFVRAFLDVKDGVMEISRAVMRSLVAVAEHKEDRLNSICTLTLAEVLAKHPALLMSANGLNVLTDALAEGTFQAPEAIVASFLYILDLPQYRRYLSTGTEFEAVFAPFTDPLLLNGDQAKLKMCAKAISAMLKTWPGFLTLSMNNAQALKSLVDSLAYPEVFLRDIILELFFDVLRIKAPSWSSTFLAGRRLTVYGRLGGAGHEHKIGKSTFDAEVDGRFNLTTHFSTFVLATLLRIGLLPALVNLVQDQTDVPLKRKATVLLTEVLKQVHRSLPAHASANLQVLGELISPTMRNTETMLSNMSIIYQIDSINRAIGRTASNQTGRLLHADELAVGPQAMEKSKFSAIMDGDSFRQAIAESLVTSHHSYIKWKWDIINDLIAGPLTNPKRLDEAIKSSKFMQRLTGFFRPFKEQRFSSIRNTKPNQRYVRSGCALIRTLTQTSIGLQYLVESKFLRQLAECLAQVDRQSGLTSSTPLFDRAQMEETLSGGYFAILGALSESVEGIQIMERWHMMNMFYHIVEREDREDLVRALLEKLDYTQDSHLRVVLSKALTSGRKNIRAFATTLLRKYTVGRVQYSVGLKDPMSSHWALRLVLTQLYDPEVEVCETAVKILEEACDQRSHLEYVVKCRPALDHLGEIGAPLLLRFLSTSTGYRYLDGLDYITQEMDDWFLGRNDAYVGAVEASLARAYLEPNNSRGIEGDENIDLEDLGLLPPHFYRELAHTEEGCKLLRKSGHFYEFSATIRDFRLEDEDYETLVRIKACLWAVGNVGSMELGAPFLEESNVVGDIVRIAEGAEAMSVRGTACFALGLLSRSLHGCEMLAECGWDTATDSRGTSLGLCLPREPARWCPQPKIQQLEPPQPSNHDTKEYRAMLNDADPVRSRILRSVVEMGNSVMYKRVATELQGLKAKHPSSFANDTLFRKVLILLESHHYRLQARQFILDLFDKSVLRRIVFESDGENESEAESD